MRWKILLFFAALNTLVLAIGFLALGRLETVRQTASGAWGQSGVSGRASSNSLPVRTVIVYQTNQIDWRELESADYRQYIANLRRVGCPEPTIRDIIMTDVMRLYAQRRGQLSHNGRPFNYWETNDKRALKKDQLEEREHQLALIDRDLPAVLRELLGINYEREINKYFTDSAEDDRRLAFLSEDKRSRVLALRDQFEAKREQILLNHNSAASNSDLSPEEIAQLRQIDLEQATALKGALTPEEREKYYFATSDTGNRLRADLVGFNPTEAEFREIYERQQQIDAKYQYANLDDETVRAAKAADVAAMDRELTSVLGQDRIADYNRAKDPDYRAFSAFAEQYEIPTSTSQDVLAMQQVAQEQRQKLLDDAQLTPDRRAAALRIIQTETERAVREALGNATYDAFAHGVGSWIQNLGPGVPVPTQQ
jgi:hypothetical protein